MGFDLGDILSEGPSDGLVPTISDVEPFADALDASVPSLSFFRDEEVQQRQQGAVPAPAAAMQAPAQQFRAAIAEPAPVPAAAVLPASPMLGGQQQQQMFGGMMGFPDFLAQQQMEQQVPSLMQQQYVVRGDMVNALPQTNMIPSMHAGRSAILVILPPQWVLLSSRASGRCQQSCQWALAAVVWFMVRQLQQFQHIVRQLAHAAVFNTCSSEERRGAPWSQVLKAWLLLIPAFSLQA
jgi:hypothetical protein